MSLLQGSWRSNWALVTHVAISSSINAMSAKDICLECMFDTPSVVDAFMGFVEAAVSYSIMSEGTIVGI